MNAGPAPLLVLLVTVLDRDPPPAFEALLSGAPGLRTISDDGIRVWFDPEVLYLDLFSVVRVVTRRACAPKRAPVDRPV
jgi:hypothetical protein